MSVLSLRAQTELCGAVALRYQHCADNKVPQLHTPLSDPL